MEYKRIELPSDIARVNEEITFDKDYANFMFLKNDVPVKFKINSINCDELSTDEIDGFENNVGCFKRLFISHNAGAVGTKIVVLAYR
jgi:hypothetical protein